MKLMIFLVYCYPFIGQTSFGTIPDVDCNLIACQLQKAIKLQFNEIKHHTLIPMQKIIDPKMSKPIFNLKFWRQTTSVEYVINGTFLSIVKCGAGHQN